jgi:hypothetical protein
MYNQKNLELRATPTVLQMGFAFLFLQKKKKLQNSYPMVWQMGFAFLLTWQNPEMNWHICKLAIGLAFYLTRYSRVRSSLPRRQVSFLDFGKSILPNRWT